MRVLMAITFAAAALFAMNPSAHAFDPDARTVYGVKLGIGLAGGVTVSGRETRDFDTETGLSIGAFYDLRLGRRVYGGVFLDRTSFKAAYNSQVTRYDLGLAVKALVGRPGSGYAFRPGIAIGYGGGTMEKDPAIGFVRDDSSSFLVLKGFFEVTRGRYLGELGVSWMTGGTGDDDVEYTQTYVRAGLLF